MDILLIVLGLICMIAGILGSILPVLPGLPLSWTGLLLLYLTNAIVMNFWVLGLTLAVTIIVSILNYTIPANGTKRFGGSTYGIWGTNIGLIIGIITPLPFGFIIGPFAGAFIGEMLYNSKDHKRALKAATGSFIGFLASSFMSFVVSIMFFGLFIWIVLKNKSLLF